MILDLVAGVTPRTERHPPFLGAGCQVFNGIRWCSQDRLAEHHSRRPGLTTERTRCKFAINHYYLSSASCEKMLHEMFGSVWHRALRSDLFIHQPTVSSTARSTILLHPPHLPPSLPLLSSAFRLSFNSSLSSFPCVTVSFTTSYYCCASVIIIPGDHIL